jgi:hypothetical protein
MGRKKEQNVPQIAPVLTKTTWKRPSRIEEQKERKN